MRVLIIEDDMKMRGMLKDALETVYRIDTAQTIGGAVEWIESCSYGAVLLDRNLCGEDNGMEIIPKLKKRHPSCAVMIASAYGGVEERIAGLSAGADDYLEKPYDLRELRMRLDGLIRRFAPETITSGGVCLDLVNQTITAEGKTITLSKKENDVLFFLASRPDKVFSRDDIANAVYSDPASMTSNTIDVVISHIRKKLPVDVIETVKGRGYALKNF